MDATINKRSTRSQPRIRFSLRTLFLVISLLCLVVLPVSLRVNRMRQQRAAIAEITRLGGLTSREGGPEKITKVYFHGQCKLTDQDIAKLVPRLQYLPKLNFIYIENAPLSNKAVKDLCELNSLEHVFLMGAQITDDAVNDLRRLPKIKTLAFRGERFTDKSMRSLSEMDQLQQLCLSSPEITDLGILHLASLRNLWDLDVAGTSVTEGGLKDLRKRLPHNLLVVKARGAVPEEY